MKKLLFFLFPVALIAQTVPINNAVLKGTANVPSGATLNIASGATIIAQPGATITGFPTGGGGGGSWGTITGTITDQTDLTTYVTTRLSNFTGSSNIVTVGTISTGTWHGNPLSDTYITSASTWSAKEPAISSGTTSQYWRGDKSWQTLDKTAVGLGNVANTAQVTSVTASSPLASSGGTTPNLTIPMASSSQSGALSSGDWSTFNAKEGAISSGTTAQYWRGDKSWQTLDKSAVGLGNVANTAQVTSVSGTSPIVSSGGTSPAISIPVATSSVSGYLSSTDWSTFNNKLSGNQTITLSGAVTGSGTTSISTSIANSGVSAGSYTNTNLTVGADGRITSASNGSTTAYYVNVKTYGAVGNGITDDITAINNAVAALPSSGGVLYFPPGTYKISNWILIEGKSKLTIFGDGIGTSTIKHSTGGVVFCVATANHITIRDLTADGSCTTRPAGQHGIITKCNNTVVTNVEVLNAGQFSIIADTDSGAGLTDITVSNCIIAGSNGDGIHFEKVTRGLITNNLIDSGDDAISLFNDGTVAANDNRYITISGNVCRWTTSGNLWWRAGNIFIGAGAADIVVADNIVESAQTFGIFVCGDDTHDPTNIRIEGNKVLSVANRGNAAVEIRKADHVKFVGNTVYNPVEGRLVEFFDVDHLTIADNDLTQTQNVFVQGIHCSESEGSRSTWDFVDIVNNRITITNPSSGGDSVYLRPKSGVTINDLKVVDNTLDQVTGTRWMVFNRLGSNCFIRRNLAPYVPSIYWDGGAGTAPRIDLAYAAMYLQDGSTAQSIPTGSGYTSFNGFGAASTANSILSVTVGSGTSADYIYVPYNGDYVVDFSWNGSCGTSGVTAKIVASWHAGSSDTVVSDCIGAAKFINSGENYHVSGHGTYRVSDAPGWFDLRIRHDNGGSVNFTPVYMSLRVTSVP